MSCRIIANLSRIFGRNAQAELDVLTEQQQHQNEVLAHYLEVYGVAPENQETAEEAWLYANDPQFRDESDREDSLTESLFLEIFGIA